MSAGPQFESGGGDGETTDGGGTSEDPRRQQDDEPDEPDRDGETTGPGPGDDGPRTTSGDPTRTTSNPVDQRPDEPTDRGEQVDVSDRPRVASALEQQFEEQLDRDVEPGRDFAVFRRGDRFVGRATGGFRAALSREAARAAGRDLTRPAGTRRFGAPTGPAFASGGAAVGTRTFQGTRFIGTPDVPETRGGEDLPVASGGGPDPQLERELEAAVEEETGREVDLDPQTDITFATVDGRRTATLSSAGMDKVATQPLTGAVGRVERQAPGIPTFAPGTASGLGTFAETTGGPIGRKGTAAFDVPGEGPIARNIGVSRDLGQRDAPIPVLEPGAAGPGFGAFAEATGGPTARTGETTTLEAELERAREAVDVSVEPRRGAFAAQFVEEDAEELAGRNVTASERQRQELTSTFTERAVEAPVTLPIAGVQLFKDVSDFGAEVRGSIRRRDPERIEELGGDLGQVAANTAAVGASQAIEDPGPTIAGATGTLVGSGFLFGGAAAAGPRASLATRTLVQPGEEVLGIGGHAVTRRVAGRGAAQRLFPGGEPLIFSEEAALRGARRGAAGAARGTRRIRGLFRSETPTQPVRGLGFRSAAFESEAAESQAMVGRARDFMDRVEVETRAGALAGAIPRVRVRSRGEATDPELITSEDIAPPRPMGRGPAPPGLRARLRRERARGGEPSRPLERVRFATESEFEDEVTGPLFEGRFETAVGAEELTAQAQRPAVEQDFDLGFEQRQEQRQEFDLGQETELDLEFEMETEFEPEAEARAEREIEVELELEGELESELELELGDRGPRSRRRRPDFRMGFTERQFVAPTGTVGDLLGFGRRRREPTGFVGPVTGGGDIDFEV